MTQSSFSSWRDTWPASPPPSSTGTPCTSTSSQSLFHRPQQTGWSPLTSSSLWGCFRIFDRSRWHCYHPPPPPPQKPCRPETWGWQHCRLSLFENIFCRAMTCSFYQNHKRFQHQTGPERVNPGMALEAEGRLKGDDEWVPAGHHWKVPLLNLLLVSTSYSECKYWSENHETTITAFKKQLWCSFVHWLFLIVTITIIVIIIIILYQSHHHHHHHHPYHHNQYHDDDLITTIIIIKMMTWRKQQCQSLGLLSPAAHPKVLPLGADPLLVWDIINDIASSLSLWEWSWWWWSWWSWQHASWWLWYGDGDRDNYALPYTYK